MPDNTNEGDDTSGNYSFAYRVNFTRNLVNQIKMRDEEYPVDEIDFLDKTVDN